MLHSVAPRGCNMVEGSSPTKLAPVRTFRAVAKNFPETAICLSAFLARFRLVSTVEALSAIEDLGKMGPRDVNEPTTEEVPARIRPALIVLLEAMRYAEQTGGDRWEFAVELDQLTLLGLNRNDFRWLVRKGLVEHQREVACTILQEERTDR